MEEKKLNIGIFIDTFFPMVDGVVSVVDNYARLLSEKANVTVFTIKTKKQFDDSTLPYKVVRCKSVRVLNLDYSLGTPQFDNKFREAVKNANLDIVHIHSPFSIGKTGLKYAKKHHIPVVATLHSQFKQDFLLDAKSKLIAKMLLDGVVRVFNKCDELWTMNSACAELARTYGYKGEIKIVPNATNLTNDFTERDVNNAKHELQKKYNISDDERILLSIGRVNRLKNIGFSLDVCKELSNRNFKYKFLIVGDGNDKKLFVEKTKKLGLEDSVVFTGKIVEQSEKKKIFAAADLHVFPSYYDTDGIVKIEASAFNLPTIFAKGSLASSSVEDNVSGYIGENDVKQFADRIMEVFEDTNTYSKVKENCKKVLYKHWNEVVDLVYNNYIDLIGKNNKWKRKKSSLLF